MPLNTNYLVKGQLAFDGRETLMIYEALALVILLALDVN